MEAVVDRLIIRGDLRTRVVESIETGLRLVAGGLSNAVADEQA